jgi:twitching motility protein PilI
MEPTTADRPAAEFDGALPAGLLTPTQALMGEPMADPAAASSQAASTGGPAWQFSEQSRQGFRVGSIGLMVRYEDGSELTEMPQVFRLPNAPDWFCGMANLHGMLTPVFDLSLYLGIDRDAQAKPMLLVLSHGANAAGVLIDGLPQRLRWTDDESADPGTAPALLVPHVSGAALITEQLWFDLQSASLLDALEGALESRH